MYSMKIGYTLLFIIIFYLFEEGNGYFFQQGHIQLIKCDSKDICYQKIPFHKNALKIMLLKIINLSNNRAKILSRINFQH